MLVSGIIGGVAAAALAWGLWEIRSQQQKKPPPSESAIATPRGPTLEAVGHSAIDARDAIIPGDLPFQFSKAEDHSFIGIARITVTKQPDGTFLVEQPQNTSVQFPTPTGGFLLLSNVELIIRATKLSNNLRDFQKTWDDRWRSVQQGENAQSDAASYETVFGPLIAEYSATLAPEALSVVGSLMSRLVTISLTNPSDASGALTIYHRRLIGPRAAQDAAGLVDNLRSALSKQEPPTTDPRG
jgi:hypothetical protein